MSHVLMLATVGEDVEPVMLGVRDYPVRRLVLLHVPMYESQAREVSDKLSVLHIEVQLVVIDENNVLMDTMQKVNEIAIDQGIAFKDIIMNVSSGDKMQTCSALSAAFVNGLPAIGVAPDGPFKLPVLKFSYSELVSEAKFRILEALRDMGGQSRSLGELSEASGVEKSLLSYHLRTTREGKGLEDLGLVDIERGALGRLNIGLSDMGRILLAGRQAPAP